MADSTAIVACAWSRAMRVRASAGHVSLHGRR